jgi:hypothetical protein
LLRPNVKKLGPGGVAHSISFKNRNWGQSVLLKTLRVNAKMNNNIGLKIKMPFCSIKDGQSWPINISSHHNIDH